MTCSIDCRSLYFMLVRVRGSWNILTHCNGPAGTCTRCGRSSHWAFSANVSLYLSSPLLWYSSARRSWTVGSPFFYVPGPNAVEVAAIKLHPFSVVNLLHCVLAWIATGAQHHYYVISWRKHICHNLTFNLTVHEVALHLGVTSNEKLL